MQEKYSGKETQWRNTVEKKHSGEIRWSRRACDRPLIYSLPFYRNPTAPHSVPTLSHCGQNSISVKVVFQTISNSADVSNCSIYLTKKSVFNNFLKFPAAQCFCRVAPLFKILLTLRLPDVSANSCYTVLQR